MKKIVGFILVFAIGVVAYTSLQKDTPASTVAEIVAPTVLAQTDDFTYETFSEDRFNELKGSEKFTVFVHNRACGTCVKKSNMIMDDASDFADGTILKLEYEDVSEDFRKTYEITKYDTFVSFDASGNHTTVKGESVENIKAHLGGKAKMMDKTGMADGENILAKSDSFTYETFTQERFDELKKSGEKFTVFVHNRACGTCVKKNNTIIEEVDDFSRGTILKYEYDTISEDFRKTYGITKYDTFVSFDASGNHTTVKGESVSNLKQHLSQ